MSNATSYVSLLNLGGEPITLRTSFPDLGGAGALLPGEVKIGPRERSRALPLGAVLASDNWEKLYDEGRVSLERVPFRASLIVVENRSKRTIGLEVLSFPELRLRQYRGRMGTALVERSEETSTLQLDPGEVSQPLLRAAIVSKEELAELQASGKASVDPAPLFGPPQAPYPCLGSYGADDVYFCYKCGGPIVFRYKPPHPIHILRKRAGRKVSERLDRVVDRYARRDPSLVETVTAESERVLFTAISPTSLGPGTDNQFRFLVHLESLSDRIDQHLRRSADTPDFGNASARVKKPAHLAWGSELTFVPTAPGVRFEPAEKTVKFESGCEVADFELRANLSAARSVTEIDLSTYLGPLEVGYTRVPTSRLGVEFGGPDAWSGAHRFRSAMRRKVFAAYAHDDVEVVKLCEGPYTALGDSFFVDYNLPAGVHWQPAIRKLIDDADVFQLFWSRKAAVSEEVRKEWEYALVQEERKSPSDATEPGFLRAVCWRKRCDPLPEELSHLHCAYLRFIGRYVGEGGRKAA